MYSMVKDWRNKRNMMYDTQRYSVENYFTDVQQKKEMRHSFGDDLLNNLHLLPDPLKKNLADSLITSDEPKRKPNKEFLNMETVEDRFKMEDRPIKEPEQPPMAPFSGISNFFSGVMNVISGAVFQWRPRSPAKYYDCFDDSNVSHQGSPASWQPSSAEDQNKNERAQDLISNVQTEFKSDMHKDCRSAVAQCEDKLNKVRLLLSTKPVEAPKYRSRRPRKVFVEPGNVEESFEDAFTPEDFVSLPNEPYVEYYSPFQCHREELTQTDSPKMRTKVAPVHETTEIVKTLPVNEVSNSDKNCTVVKSDNLKTESVKNDCISEKPENKIVNIVDNVKVEEKPKLNIMELQKSTETKSDKEEINSKIISKETNNIPIENAKEELISSCEDKLSKLKALMQERRKKNTKTIVTSSDSVLEMDKTNNKIPEPTKTVPIEKTQDKRFKNPCRRTEKRRKGKLRRHMLDDMMFANEIHSDDLSSAENSPSVNSLDNLLVKLKRDSMGSLPITPVGTPKLSLTPPSVTNNTEYFDEISGRFRSTSTTDSDDSFQIVFNDSPKTRKRMPSDCDSEDSFIVFEDSPDSCYTSHDVFGEESEDESDYTDSDSDLSDSGVPVTKLAHNLSRTISDLTDDSLYEDKCVDEVDCAVQSVCEEIPSEDIVDVSDEESEKKETGLLLTEAKKLLRKDQPKKKVQFSARPPEVHVMRVWSFAARQARKGHWERFALDRDRFKRRIADVDMAVSWVLKPQHRKRVMFQRFMPWWHAQRRKEIAERKQQKEEEEKRLAEEKIKREEEEKRERIKKEEEEKRIAAEEEKRLAEEKERKNKIRQELKNVTDPKTKSLMIFVHNVKRLSIDKTKPLVANKSNTESKSDSNSKESETEIICNGNDNKESSKPDKEIIVDANCNDSNGNKKLNGVINDYIKNGNEINEQKHEVIVTKCDKTDIQQSNLGSEVPKKEIIIQNGKIHNDSNGDLNKTICNENLKVLNGSNVQIKVSSETVGGT